MRLSPLLIALPFLASCSREPIANATFRGWSLDEFNPLRHAPPVVQISESTMAEIRQDRIAYEQEGIPFSPPVDFTPPTLPPGETAMNGLLLPSKDGNQVARVTDRPARPEDFSIE
jgi:hypothetical protein